MRIIAKLPRKFKDTYRKHWLLFGQVINWLFIHIKILRIQIKRLFIPVPKLGNGKMYLHLGCGGIDKKGFINIDGLPFPHIHYIQSINNLSRFDDGSVDLIYASHCIEHFSYLRTKSVLSEWFRVLKKGGVLRLSIPDFDKLVEIYKKHNNNPDVIIPQLMGGQENKYNFHLTTFNSVNLTRYLEDVGFSSVNEWQPGSDELTTFDDFSIYEKEVEGKFYKISLNIEAVK